MKQQRQTRLRARHLLAASETSLQVLRDEHRAAVRHAVRAHHDRLLSASGRRREDLARHLRPAGVHRLPAHDRRRHSANFSRHSAHRYNNFVAASYHERLVKLVTRIDCY